MPTDRIAELRFLDAAGFSVKWWMMDRSIIEPKGFWRDRFTRLGVSVAAATLVGNSLYGVLTSFGIVRWRKPTTFQEMFEFESYVFNWFVIPMVVGLLLIMIGAGRTFLPKKLFKKVFW